MGSLIKRCTMNLKQVFSPQQINSRVQELGKEISFDFRGQSLLGICILKGAFVFFADLVRNLDIDLEIDFVRLSSYGKQSSSSGEILITKDIETDIQDKDILIVEDIVDTGLSLSFLTKNLQSRGASMIRVCALIDKHERRQTSIQVDYPGFILQKGFLVGYGLDIAEKFRSLPGIHEVDPKHITH